MLFRIKHSDSSPSVIIHGDNLKKYNGSKTIILRTDVQVQTVIKQPNLRSFVHLDSPGSISYSSEYSREENYAMDDFGAACSENGAKETCVLLMEENEDADACDTFGVHETHMLLNEAVKPCEMFQMSCDGKIVQEKLFKNDRNGCVNSLGKSQAKTVRGLLKQTGFNALEHSKQLLRDDCSFNRSTDQRSTEQGKTCFHSVSGTKVKGARKTEFTKFTCFNFANGAKVKGAR